jgi:Planctomycete cytochrome C
VAVRFAVVSLTGGLLLLAAWPGLRATEPVSFSKQICPILETSCWKCHGAAMQLSRLDLRTRETALKGGDRGPAIVPGSAGESRLFRLVSGNEKPAMPMEGTAYAIAVSRPPTDEELQRALDFLKKQKPVDFAHVMLNLNEFVYIR